MTNYEKIKEMSVEEMASFLLGIEANYVEVFFLKNDCNAFYAFDCEEKGCAFCYEEYLRSEARGVNNGE